MIDGIEIVHVVAFDKNHAIGVDNRLAWHIPDDLKHFRETTANSIVLMGRKTLESIGRALPHRENIVVSGNALWEAPNTIRFGRIDTALAYCVSLAKNQNKKQVHIIGGAQIYKQTLSVVDTIEATEVDLTVIGADAFYPSFTPDQFALTTEKDHVDAISGINCTFKTFKKVI